MTSHDSFRVQVVYMDGEIEEFSASDYQLESDNLTSFETSDQNGARLVPLRNVRYLQMTIPQDQDPLDQL
jgi:hypothetical protein